MGRRQVVATSATPLTLTLGMSGFVADTITPEHASMAMRGASLAGDRLRRRNVTQA